MHRIDGPGAVNSLFTEGDPTVPQMATVVSAAWLNDVQENLTRTIEAAGIAPVKGDFDQLRQAINLLSGAGEVGEGRIWFTETLPASGDWLECDGSSLLIVDYPALYAVLGTTWGTAPTGHFRLPDLRGLALRGWDHGRGLDPDAALRTGGDHVGSTQDDAVKKHNHPLGGTVGTAAGQTGVVDVQAWDNGPYNYYSKDFQVTSDKNGASALANVPVAAETRMKNANVMFIIRWR
ncbi:MAG: phage tail protein [Desulfovibrio sp.]